MLNFISAQHSGLCKRKILMASGEIIVSHFLEKQMKCQREMPRYKCHKEVWALKIAGIEFGTDGSAIIIPEEDGYAPFNVTNDYMLKHNPHVGGYFVVYKDGYKSFSPENAFEDGYSPV